MHLHFLRQLARRHSAWLLWLALLIPVAQAAVQAHVLSHGVAALQGVAADDGLPAPDTAHCDLCLSASALGAGALAGPPPTLQHAAAQHAAPYFAPHLAWTAPRAWAYRSRAPPVSGY
ncbi:MAG: hypothetical protein IPP87_25935 [Ideonella sp.]|jgi:hypothetical protein|nr:hypothetical protein [Ideonella sp.]MBL0151906.1 hypothetical protein [Ideonella sp.]